MDNKTVENKTSKDNTVKCSKVIKTCKYSCVVSGAYHICNYLNMAGHSRGCPPEQYTKYEKKRKANKRPVKLPKGNHSVRNLN